MSLEWIAQVYLDGSSGSDDDDDLCNADLLQAVKTEVTELAVVTGEISDNCNHESQTQKENYCKKGSERPKQSSENGNSGAFVLSENDLLPSSSAAPTTMKNKVDDDRFSISTPESGDLPKRAPKGEVVTYVREDQFPVESEDEHGPVTTPKVCYKCPFCFELFSEAAALIDHLPEHTTPGIKKKRVRRDSKSVQCRKCAYSCYGIGALRKHSEVHRRKGKPFKCSLCPSYFRTRPGLRMHEMHIHKLNTNSSSQHPKNIASLGTTPSKHCDEKRGTEQEDQIPKLILTRCDNLIQKHRAASSLSLISESELDANISPGRRLMIKKGLVNFKPRGGKAVADKKETKGPPQEIKELVQVVNAHGGNKQKEGFRCKLCQKIFSCQGNACQHIRTIHWGEKKFSCTVCQKKFATKQQLQYHSMIHSGLKPYKCSLCSMAFSIPSNLKVHIMYHKKIRPHKCAMCSKCFTRPADMRKHACIHT